jgi:hypothetical protein
LKTRRKAVGYLSNLQAKVMDNKVPENAVAAIRVSSVRQGTEGDSPEAQREQIERFALTHNINLKQTFVFLESASKENQPMQQAIDYCKDPKNDVQMFIIKSIDRFTRGGATPYDQLKMQLEKYGVKLVDIYGIISGNKVNTLEHLGVKYRWSEYSPSQKMEFLEAERAKDELRDIMSRMIGAEVRYTRMGYWMRRPPYGYSNVRVDTDNGKRYILQPKDSEAPFVKKMFELRLRGNLSDTQIVNEINRLGYKSRNYYRRVTHGNDVVTKRVGGNKLTLKRFWIYIQNPIYAGIICEKWTNDQPLKAQFKGLVSYDTFNAANRNKLNLAEFDGVVTLTKQATPDFQLRKGSHNEDYSYRRVVMCSDCRQPLYGSAPRGRHGKRYPGYHCDKRGHYFRVPKAKLENTVGDFTQALIYAPDHVDDLIAAARTVWEQRQQVVDQEENLIDTRIVGLEAQALAMVDKLKLLSSETAIKYVEEDLMKIEAQMNELKTERQRKETAKPLDFSIVLQYVKYFLNHLDYLLLKQSDAVKRANFFGLIFNESPTYAELECGITNPSQITGINELFKLKNVKRSLLVGEEGLEPSRALSSQDFESSVYTNFTTRPRYD